MAPHRMPARQVSSCCGDSFAVVRRAVPSAEVGEVLARPRGRRIEAKRMLRRPCAGGRPRQTPARRRTLSTRQGRRFFRSTACGGAEQRGIESKRTITRRIHSSAVAAAGRRAVAMTSRPRNAWSAPRAGSSSSGEGSDCRGQPLAAAGPPTPHTQEQQQTSVPIGREIPARAQRAAGRARLRMPRRPTSRSARPSALHAP